MIFAHVLKFFYKTICAFVGVDFIFIYYSFKFFCGY